MNDESLQKPKTEIPKDIKKHMKLGVSFEMARRFAVDELRARLRRVSHFDLTSPVGQKEGE